MTDVKIDDNIKYLFLYIYFLFSVKNTLIYGAECIHLEYRLQEGTKSVLITKSRYKKYQV